MQTVEAFGQVQTALSFFRISYDDFASYRAVINRLSGFLDSIESVERLGGLQIEDAPHQLLLKDLTVSTPAGLTLVKNLNLALPRSATLLIRGPSGVGKSTLLRAVAGIWPHAEGKVARPSGTGSLFLPQKPYLPLGTLRTALYYPLPAQSDNQAAAVLLQCHLGHLISRLDEEDDWTRILSLGEQQRLAIGRALLNRPQILFLDEASSAMDEGLEHAMYQLLRESLSEAILVSVGHRSSLMQFHAQELALQGEGNWKMHSLA